MSENQAAQRAAEGEQRERVPRNQPPNQPPQPIQEPWYVPRFGAYEPPTVERILEETHTGPMQPMSPNPRPSTDLADAFGRALGPPGGDVSPRTDQVGEGQPGQPPMFRRGGTTSQITGMVCPRGTIGNCIYCQSLPCSELKAKVLEVCAADYRLMTMQPRIPPQTGRLA